MSANLITISHAKRALDRNSREFARMQQYAKALDSLHIIVFTTRTDGYEQQLHEGSLHVYPTNSRTKVGALLRAYSIGRQIIRSQVASKWIVSSQDPFETSLVGRALARAHNVTHHIQIHGDVFNPTCANSSFLQRLRGWYGRYAVRRTERIRVVSERIKRSVVALGVPASAVTVLPVQAGMSHLLSLFATRTYQEHSPVRLLFLGRLAPEKQVDRIVRACALLRTSNIFVQLRLVGSGPEEAGLRELVAKLQLQHAVEFVPWVDDVSAELQAADLLCLSSAHEGWGMVLLEAAATGLPAVSSDVGCVGECLVPEVSVLVAHTPKEIAAAIQQGADPSVRQRIGTAAHQAAQDFSQHANTYLEQWVAAHI